MMQLNIATRPTGNSRPAARQWRQIAATYVHLLALVAGAGLLLGIPASSEAATDQSQASLREAARSFLEEQMLDGTVNTVEISIGRLDPRLHLSRCTSALQPFLPAGTRLQGKLTVGIRCPTQKPWTVYLPANIRIFGEVLTTARPLSRGDILRAADILPVRQEISELNGGYYLSTEDVAGKILTRATPAGTPLSPRMLKAPLMVRRGDDVTLLATIGALQVRGKGKALQDAARGERVAVRNVHSKRIVEGVAIKAGTVQIPL